MLVDSHCHLDFPDFSEELPAVIARAHDAGIETMVTICTHLAKFPQVLKVATSFDNIFCTVGVHPHEAEKEPLKNTAQLIELAAHPKVIGIGETGLDYFYDHSPRDVQQKNFRIHIEAARQTGLPIIIHSRDAEADTMKILKEEMEQGAFTGVLHCFSSKPELAFAAVELGLYVSFSGILTFKKAEELRETSTALPLTRLLVETDAPYLAPMPHRGKRNEPAFTRDTAQILGQCHGLSLEDISQQTTHNFFRLFQKASKPG